MAERQLSRRSFGVLAAATSAGLVVGGRTALAAPALPPVGPTVLFVADYENGDISPWGETAACPPNTEVTVVQDQVRQGKFAAHHRVSGPGECFGDKSHRAEVVNYDLLVHEGDERWYQWSTRFADTFPAPNGVWFIIMQWHSGSGSPPLAINVNNDNQIEIGGDGVDHPELTLGPVTPGQWVDFTVHVKFSNDADVGFVEGYYNGNLVVPLTKRATMSSDSNYLKQGIYRDPSNGSTTHEVWHDGLIVTGP